MNYKKNYRYRAYIKAYIYTGYGSDFIKFTTTNQKLILKVLNRPSIEDKDDYCGTVINPFIEKKVSDVYIGVTARWEKFKIFKIRKPRRYKNRA